MHSVHCTHIKYITQNCQVRWLRCFPAQAFKKGLNRIMDMITTATNRIVSASLFYSGICFFMAWPYKKTISPSNVCLAQIGKPKKPVNITKAKRCSTESIKMIDFADHIHCAEQDRSEFSIHFKNTKIGIAFWRKTIKVAEKVPLRKSRKTPVFWCLCSTNCRSFRTHNKLRKD